MARVRRGEQFHYEDERIDSKLRAVRVSFDGCAYRVLYSRLGSHYQIMLALHVLDKRSERLPKAARKLAARRLTDWTSR
jgi:phage-related protein